MTGSGRFDVLDGIRAVAIAAVLALHWLSWYTPFFHGGSVGVDVFFVLSGFIITTVLWRAPAPSSWPAAYGRFLWRRAVRLYPALAGLVVGCLVLYAVVPFAPQSPAEVAERGALVLGQGSAAYAAGQHGSFWLPSLQPFGQTWSLAVEWYFYLLWPLAVLAARARGWSAHRLSRLCVAVAVAAYAVSLPLPAFPFYFGPTGRSAELLAGAALALHLLGTDRRPVRHATPLAAIALALVVLYTALGADGHSPLYRCVGVPVAVLSTVVLIRSGYADRRGAVARLLAHPWSAAVGRASYSLYLWHIVPFLLLAEAPGDVPKPVLGLAAVTSAVVLTWLSHRFLERPFLRPRGDVLTPGRGTSEVRAVRPTTAHPA